MLKKKNFFNIIFHRFPENFFKKKVLDKMARSKSEERINELLAELQTATAIVEETHRPRIIANLQPKVVRLKLKNGFVKQAVDPRPKASKLPKAEGKL
jgi:hypothetical protein